jgi:hypothetical protein
MNTTNFRFSLFSTIALLAIAASARAAVLPNNFWPNPTFESGSNLDQTNGTPTNWTRDGGAGGGADICQVITNNSVSASHSLAVIDNAAGDFGEWRSDVNLGGNATNGDVLNIQWYEMYNLSAPEMRLTVQFFNASSNDVGTVHFTTSGTSSAGWVSTIANSTFTKRNATLVVPGGAVAMRCALASGGAQAITGVMVIDDLSVACVARLLPGNFWVNPTFENGSNLSQTNGTPANWTRGGTAAGATNIAQVITNNSVSSSHSLALIDNTVSFLGEWYSDVSLVGKASPGDLLNIQWFQMYSVAFPMRLSVQFFGTNNNNVGSSADFTTAGTTNAGWMGDITSSTFTRRNEVLLVPNNAVRMRCSLVSGALAFNTGVLVIDDLSVARAPVPGNFWVNSTFELGTDLDQTNGTPANWTRGGGDATIDQVTTSNSVSLSHGLAVVDDNADIDFGYGEWYSDVTLIGNATNGQALNIQWYEMYNVSVGPQHEMRLTAQFFNATNDLVGETHFTTVGTSSAGWVSSIADSTFTKRNGALLVPVGAVRMRCALVSGGSGVPTGVMVIDDLTVALNSAVPVIPPTVLAGNFFPNPTFEVGSLLDNPAAASPAGWTRGGNDTTIDQVTTSNSVSPTHSLSLVDNSFSYGEWYQYLTLSGVAANDVLDVQWFRLYDTVNGNMRLTFGFRDAGGVSFGPEYNFESGGQSPGWLGSVATSPFERVASRFLVPAGAGQLSIKFASGGAGDVTGLMVIDDLSVRISKPVITSITADGGGKTIEWLSMPSKLYTVQFTTNLNSVTDWTALITGQAGDLSLTNIYVDTATHVGNGGFYRIKQQ